MLARIGWIGSALATGLLLQIAVQINLLHWLPDFPIYLGLALLSATIAALAAPFASTTTVPAPPWMNPCARVCFASFEVVHAVLAAKSSSSFVEGWRNIMLWPALAIGILACVFNGPRWLSLPILWPLGEAAAAILACWYAPSLGEPQSLRAYQYVLLAAIFSIVLSLAIASAEPGLRKNRSLWGFVVASLAFGLICLAQPDAERAQPLMLAMGVLRLGLIMLAANRWLKGEGEPSSLKATAKP